MVFSIQTHKELLSHHNMSLKGSVFDTGRRIYCTRRRTIALFIKIHLSHIKNLIPDSHSITQSDYDRPSFIPTIFAKNREEEAPRCASRDKPRSNSSEPFRLRIWRTIVAAFCRVFIYVQSRLIQSPHSY